MSAVQESTLIVVQKDDHSLGYFAYPCGRELHRVALPAYPHEFAIDADGKFAYCCHFGLKLAEDAGPGGDEVSIVDLEAGAHVASIHCGPWRRPHGISFDGAGRLYVLSEGSGHLLVVSKPASRVIDRAIPTRAKGSHIVSVTPDGRQAFTSNMFDGTVSMLDLAVIGAEPVKIAVGRRPEGSAFDATGSRLLVCNRESSDLSVIDVPTASEIGRIATPPGPVRITRMVDNRFAVACYHDQSVIDIDADSGRLMQRVGLAGKPVSIGFDPGSQRALAGLIPQGVCLVDFSAGCVSGLIATREGPDPMVVLHKCIPARRAR